MNKNIDMFGFKDIKHKHKIKDYSNNTDTKSYIIFNSIFYGLWLIMFLICFIDLYIRGKI